MGPPDKRREADELVEPLFAGLSGAEQESEAAASETEEPIPPADPWKNPHAPLPLDPGSDGAIQDVEPATFPLVLKALLFLIVLVAISAFVYLTVGV